MGKVSSSYGISTLRGDGLGVAPQEGLPDLGEAQISPEIQRLFELALEGALPRSRELKAWEPQTLNERHLSMIMMRVSGVKQREIAQIFGATDSNVSIVLNHPDAEYLLSRLHAARFSMPNDIEKRLEALNEDAVRVLEELMSDEEVSALKKTPAAFKLLERNGYGKKQVVEHEHRHRLEANGDQLAQLASALRESRSIEDQPTIEVTDLNEAQRLLQGPIPGGEPAVSPPSALSGSPDAGAPSISDPQDKASDTGDED